MTPAEYIASGALELYVLGDLSAEDRQQAEAMLAAHPEVREELRLIEESVEAMAKAGAIDPPASAKPALLSAIDNSPETTTGRETAVRPLRPMWSNYLTAASVSLLLVSGFFAYYFFGKWQAAEEQLSNLIAQNQKMAQDYNLVNERLDALAANFSIINNPSFRSVALRGTDSAPAASGNVYWNESTAEVYLSIQNLQAIAADQQFQLWAIVDGTPVDAGVFDADNIQALIQLKDIVGATAFAITIEPRGGSVSPSLETMQVYGEG